MQTKQTYSKRLLFLAALFIAAAPTLAAEGDAKKESELIAVLRSDAPGGEKAITCKLLAIHGSSEAVPELAKLLDNPQLSSWARIALEAIPGEASEEALRTAAKTLKGKRLVGTINSIAVRRDSKAVELLTARLQDKDTDVASAAAVALGRIGDAASTKSLRAALANAPAGVRSSVAEGLVFCAERLQQAGDSAQSVAIYDDIRNVDVPKPRIVEATRGAILARNQDGIPLLLEQFRSTDKRMFQLALTIAREFPGDQVDKVLVTELAKATPQRAALIVLAMTDRNDTVVLSAVLAAAVKGPKPVRVAAIDGLARVGDASCLAALLQIAGDQDADLAQSAKATLAILPGDDIDTQIVTLLTKADTKSFPLLLDLVGQRRIDAVPVLIKALSHSDRTVRTAALKGLGETITYKDLSVLITLVTSPKSSLDATAAQQALKAAAIRMPDREACATALAAAYSRSRSLATKGKLLEILAEVGGTKALATMSSAGKSSSPELQDVSTRLLGKWMTEDAAPVLLDLSSSAKSKSYQIRAMRGYIRIARQFVIPEQRRAEMCEKALASSQRVEEKKLVLEVLVRYPNKSTLAIATKATRISGIQKEAATARAAIAKKLGN